MFKRLEALTRRSAKRSEAGIATPEVGGMLKPILVLGSGRNGSTALMSLLGGSPLIAFDKRYPYESAYLSYFVQLAATMGRPHDQPEEGWARSSLVAGASNVIGPIPFQTEGFINREELSRAAFRSLWAGFSRVVIENAIGAGHRRPTHFAEKAGFFTIDLSEAELGAFQIFLLRDPRDVMMSAKRFNEKRGTLRFGWRSEDTDESFARRTSKRVRRTMETVIAVGDGEPNRIVVRYEDLVLDQYGTARRLSDFLGVQLRVADQLAANEEHKTSADPASSIGRWRHEMSDKVKSIFDKRLGDLLDSAGYERANVPRRRRPRPTEGNGASDGT